MPSRSCALPFAANDRRTVFDRTLAFFDRLVVFKVARHVTDGVLAPEHCWANYSSWMRTVNVSRTPSEWVVQLVLRKTFAELLADAAGTPNWVKFIRERMDLKRYRPAA